MKEAPIRATKRARTNATFPNRKAKGTLNFKVKDGFKPNLPNLSHDLVQVFYSSHALDSMRLPSRGYDSEVLSKFPILCKSKTGLHPYDLKRQMGDAYNRLDWEYDLFKLRGMPIRSYRTVNDQEDGEVESAMFVDRWSKKWFAMVVRLNLIKNASLERGSDLVVERHYKATTIHPVSWKEAEEDERRWERFLP
jgi:hypothetical protein